MVITCIQFVFLCPYHEVNFEYLLQMFEEDLPQYREVEGICWNRVIFQNKIRRKQKIQLIMRLMEHMFSSDKWSMGDRGAHAALRDIVNKYHVTSSSLESKLSNYRIFYLLPHKKILMDIMENVGTNRCSDFFLSWKVSLNQHDLWWDLDSIWSKSWRKLRFYNVTFKFW